MRKTNFFMTSCGFRFEWDGEEWLWFNDDMTCDADDAGHPIDDNGERLTGIYTTKGAQS